MLTGNYGCLKLQLLSSYSNYPLSINGGPGPRKNNSGTEPTTSNHANLCKAFSQVLHEMSSQAFEAALLHRRCLSNQLCGQVQRHPKLHYRAPPRTSSKRTRKVWHVLSVTNLLLPTYYPLYSSSEVGMYFPGVFPALVEDFLMFSSSSSAVASPVLWFSTSCL